MKFKFKKSFIFKTLICFLAIAFFVNCFCFAEVTKLDTHSPSNVTCNDSKSDIFTKVTQHIPHGSFNERYSNSKLNVSTVALNTKYENYMTDLPDNAIIKFMAMVGTHDAATKYLLGGSVVEYWAKCQDLIIADQLKTGVRLLDLRIDANTVLRHGGTYCLKDSLGPILYLRDVLKDVKEFLVSHPGEAVFVMLKQNDGSDGSITSSANKVLNKFADYIYSGEKDFDDLTLGDIRGKMVILATESAGDINNAYKLTRIGGGFRAYVGKGTMDDSDGNKNESADFIYQDLCKDVNSREKVETFLKTYSEYYDKKPKDEESNFLLNYASFYDPVHTNLDGGIDKSMDKMWNAGGLRAQLTLRAYRHQPVGAVLVDYASMGDKCPVILYWNILNRNLLVAQ